MMYIKDIGYRGYSQESQEFIHGDLLTYTVDGDEVHMICSEIDTEKKDEEGRPWMKIMPVVSFTVGKGIMHSHTLEWMYEGDILEDVVQKVLKFGQFTDAHSNNVYYGWYMESLEDKEKYHFDVEPPFHWKVMGNIYQHKGLL